ncbi:hypothetical protein QFZ72_000038 [Bacillus sp. V2I10]|nr:hypothetical protein [Bacillus sp. V2I10]
MYDTWINSHFINTVLFPILVLGVAIIISAIFIHFVTKSKNFYLALTTGIRQGELLGLRWKDLNLEKGLLNIKQTLSHDGKTFLSGAKTYYLKVLDTI